mgnify:CR=1 FL=1
MTTALMPAYGTHLDTFDVSGTPVQLLWTETRPTVVAKHLCEQFGLSWSRQAKVLKDPASGFNCGLTAMVGADGKDRDMLSLSVADAIRWVMGIKPAKVAASARDRLIAFQASFVPALFAHVEMHWRRKADLAIYFATKSRLTLLRRDRMASHIVHALGSGLSFAEIKATGPSSWTSRALSEKIAELIVLGEIDLAPAGTPIFEPPSRDSRAETDQLEMFAEG